MKPYLNHIFNEKSNLDISTSTFLASHISHLQIADSREIVYCYMLMIHDSFRQFEGD